LSRFAIIGLGLIGGSLGLALKRAELKDLEIVGHDAEWGRNGRARKLGAIDREARTAAQAVEGAAVVVIAAPILSMRDVFEQIAPALGDGAVVTDTASTKRDVVRWAQELLPEEVSFVGGHPIAGKETSGIDAADADLFQGRPWAITPPVHASERSIKTVENLVSLVGANPVHVDAEEHDTYLAAASHLPLVVSTALFSLVSQSHAWPDIAAVAGPGFRDTTRLASTNPDMSHNICLTNRENLLHWIDRFGEELQRFRSLIDKSEDQEELSKAFYRAQTDRDAFLETPPRHEEPAQEGDTLSTGERMLSLMVGEYVVRRRKEIEGFLDRKGSGKEEEKGGRRGDH
jgi:prephenate dehydrogenase